MVTNALIWKFSIFVSSLLCRNLMMGLTMDLTRLFQGNVLEVAENANGICDLLSQSTLHFTCRKWLGAIVLSAYQSNNVTQGSLFA